MVLILSQNSKENCSFVVQKNTYKLSWRKKAKVLLIFLKEQFSSKFQGKTGVLYEKRSFPLFSYIFFSKNYFFDAKGSDYKDVLVVVTAKQIFWKYLIISQSTTQGFSDNKTDLKSYILNCFDKSGENSLQFRDGRDKGWHDVSKHFFAAKVHLQFFSSFFHFFIFIFLILSIFLTCVTLRSRRTFQAKVPGHPCPVVP